MAECLGKKRGDKRGLLLTCKVFVIESTSNTSSLERGWVCSEGEGRGRGGGALERDWVCSEGEERGRGGGALLAMQGVRETTSETCLAIVPHLQQALWLCHLRQLRSHQQVHLPLSLPLLPGKHLLLPHSAVPQLVPQLPEA